MRRVLLVSLVVVLAVLSLSVHAAVNDLWVAESDGALLLASGTGELVVEITGLTRVRAVEVDLVRRSLWVFENKDLHRFDLTGKRISSAGLEGVSSSAHAAIAVHPPGGLVWIGVDDQLRAIDGDGVVLVLPTLPDSVVDVAADPENGRVLVSTRSGLHSFDAASGVELWKTALEGPVGRVALDLASGDAWVATGGEVRRYDGLGFLLASHAVPDAQAVAVDETGIWAATKQGLLRLDPDGTTTFSTAPFDGKGEIGHLVMAGDRSVWVANHQEIAHYSDSGALLQRLSFKPPIHVWDLASNRDFHPPALELLAPSEDACIPSPTVPFEVTYGDIGWGVDPATIGLAIDGAPVAISCSSTPDSGSCTLVDPQADGPHTLVASVEDYAENVTETAARTVFVDTIAPQIDVASPEDGLATRETEITIAGSLSESAALALDGEPVPVGSDLTFSAGPLLLIEGENVFELRAVDCAGNATTTQLTVMFEPSTGEDLPPDPSTVATAIDLTVVTDIAASTEFLYNGPNPIQREMTPGVIDPRRVAVIRGAVKDPDGAALSGVRIQILDLPELGWTLSRDDGTFDLAVNGGGRLVVDYQKDGFLQSQRRVETPWRDFVWADDVVLVPIDPAVTVVAAGSSEVQVARGSEVQDADGTRQATVVFPSGLSAQMVLPDGTRQPLTSFAFRATEYTVGPDGPASMPGELPATTGYTYAVELSVDEALSAGASSVELDRPAYHYVENFLGFPVGGIVPAGYYDRKMAAWIPSENGRVIAILDTAGGIASLDVDGSGQPATPAALADLGFGAGELESLAELYEPGQSLWRTPIPHFTPWDCNWPYGPPADAEEPPDPDSDRPDPEQEDIEEQDDDDPEEDEDDSPCEQGSIIDCENQTLGESVPVAGTPYHLSYRSSRVPGRTVANSVEVRLSGQSVPASLKRIELTISIAGRRMHQSFPPLPHQRHTFTWDRKDGYGRTLQGVHRAVVRVGYVYDGVYYTPAEFERSFGAFSSTSQIVGDIARTEITVERSYLKNLGMWDATPAGLGGWTISDQHAYDFNSRTLHLGDGSQRRGERVGELKPLSTPGLGSRASWVSMIQGPDGLYLSELRTGTIHVRRAYVHRIGADGIIRTVFWRWSDEFAGFAVDAVGRHYVGECFRLSRFPEVWRSQVSEGISAARLVWSTDDTTCYSLVKAAPDGSLLIFRHASRALFRLWPDGQTAPADTVLGLLGPDGSVYYSRSRRVWRLRPDGSLTAVAGTGQGGFGGDGGPATEALLGFGNAGLAFSADGALLIADSSNGRVRAVLPDGTIHTLAELGGWVDTIGVDRHGSVYVSGSGTGGPSFGKIGKLFPVFNQEESKVADASGRLVFSFDAAGRHRTTFNTLTGAVERSFEYDGRGLLTAIRDGDGDVTTIERDSDGSPSAIVGPFGQRTELSVGADGFLTSVKLPGQREYTFEYGEGGLLRGFTNPRGMTSRFDYAARGRLTRATDPAGGWKELRRFVANGRFRVELRTRGGRTTSYSLRGQVGPGVSRTMVTAGAPATARERLSDGSRTLSHPTGTVARVTSIADRRFGLEAPTHDRSVTFPSGLTYSSSVNRHVTLSNPGDPLSLLRQADTFTVNGRVGRRLFEAPERRLTFTSPEGRQVAALTDELLRPLSIHPPGTVPLAVTYDERGRPTRISQGEGAELRSLLYSYRDDGYLGTVTDPLGRTVSMIYDDAGRIVDQQLPGDRTVGFGYDANDNLITVVPPGRPAHRFEYNAVDRVTRYAPPGLGSGSVDTTYEYDHDRKLTLVGRPDGRSIGFDYDESGRLAVLLSPDGEIDYSYEPLTGNITSITGPGSVDLSYDYDGLLLTATTWSGEVAGSVSRQYDSDLRVVSRCVNAVHCVTFERDDDGLLRRAGELTLTRDSGSGRVAATSLGVITTAQTYTSFGELETFAASVSGSPIFAYTLRRDLAGRIVEKIETVQGVTTPWTYRYDPAGRLDRVEKNGAFFAQYTYDANGNRLSYEGTFGSAVGTYDAQDRLTSYGDSTFEYTANGDLLRRREGGHSVAYGYDVYGNLRNVELADGLSIEYVVDGEHRRVGKKIEGALVKAWLYKDQLNPVAELDGAGDVVARFVYGSMPHVPDVIIKGSATYRVLTDHLGSVRMIVDAVSGEVVQRVDYDEFGRVLLNTNPGLQLFGFAGGIHDQQTDLVRFGARDYSPAEGRWTTKDRAKFEARELNLYGYVGGDPINLIDVSGLAGCTVDFPGYPITIPGTNKKVPLNHAGVLAYDDEGNTRYYEYGRYPPGDHGRVRRQTVPDLEIGPDGKPTEESWEALKEALEDGPGNGRTPLISCKEESDYDKIIDFAEERRRKPQDFPAYSWNPLNPNTCVTFAREAVEAGLR